MIFPAFLRIPSRWFGKVRAPHWTSHPSPRRIPRSAEQRMSSEVGRTLKWKLDKFPPKKKADFGILEFFQKLDTTETLWSGIEFQLSRTRMTKRLGSNKKGNWEATRRGFNTVEECVPHSSVSRCFPLSLYNKHLPIGSNWLFLGVSLWLCPRNVDDSFWLAYVKSPILYL